MRIRIIDAFTDRPFAGNPAGVCLLDDGFPSDAWMQRVASELNLSETAFAHPLPPGEDADWAIRWFTPVDEEVRLCGHATLATAHALAASGPVRFRSLRSGVLVTRGNEDGSITLDFPAATVTRIPQPAGLTEALGVAPESTHTATVTDDLLAVLPDETAVREAAPDQAALAALLTRESARGLIVTAAARNHDAHGAHPADGTKGADGTQVMGGTYDFVSRFFAPTAGIPEDPVTGSAHVSLAPFWSARLGRIALTALQASPRTGLLHTSVHGDRVHLRGHAVTVLDGTLHSEPF
ncbi:PhzF family phenazine biosynthesis protein [Streptomyces sp. GC420]|uniref:PhzF family phenazine biosynthesis protein n=1 Tax=Streptomyces sp. GC420 TaxID=2697568 RepID=UPI0014151BDB|nr:PhzF family phenazine biosynthesis protein [Streptomyces sp. GC420]NBM18287.1 PhzF family phenazine biosynthesis isomerase [Streptomyces sp. GC420]